MEKLPISWLYRAVQVPPSALSRFFGRWQKSRKEGEEEVGWGEEGRKG